MVGREVRFTFHHRFYNPKPNRTFKVLGVMDVVSSNDVKQNLK